MAAAVHPAASSSRPSQVKTDAADLDAGTSRCIFPLVDASAGLASRRRTLRRHATVAGQLTLRGPQPRSLGGSGSARLRALPDPRCLLGQALLALAAHLGLCPPTGWPRAAGGLVKTGGRHEGSKLPSLLTEAMRSRAGPGGPAGSVQRPEGRFSFEEQRFPYPGSAGPLGRRYRSASGRPVAPYSARLVAGTAGFRASSQRVA